MLNPSFPLTNGRGNRSTYIKLPKYWTSMAIFLAVGYEPETLCCGESCMDKTEIEVGDPK